MNLEPLAESAKRLRERRVAPAVVVVTIGVLLTPSVWYATQDPLTQPSPLEWLYYSLWHLGIIGLFALSFLYFLAGYADFLDFKQQYGDQKYSDILLLCYALRNRILPLSAVILIMGAALVVGFVVGVSLTAFALYSVGWAILLGFVSGLPFSPVHEEFEQLNSPES